MKNECKNCGKEYNISYNYEDFFTTFFCSKKCYQESGKSICIDCLGDGCESCLFEGFVDKNLRS